LAASLWSFDASLILPFAIASLCASVKTIGNLTTCQKSNDADWPVLVFFRTFQNNRRKCQGSENVA
jgi:hypothetical protein